MGPLPRSLAPGGASLADVVVPGGRCGREAWSLGRPGRERRTRPLAASWWFGFSVPQQDPIRGVTERGRGGAMGAGLGPAGAAGGWARGERGPDSAGSVSCCPIGVWSSRPAPAPCPPRVWPGDGRKGLLPALRGHLSQAWGRSRLPCLGACLTGALSREALARSPPPIS